MGLQNQDENFSKRDKSNLTQLTPEFSFESGALIFTPPSQQIKEAIGFSPNSLNLHLFNVDLEKRIQHGFRNIVRAKKFRAAELENDYSIINVNQTPYLLLGTFAVGSTSVVKPLLSSNGKLLAYKRIIPEPDEATEQTKLMIQSEIFSSEPGYVKDFFVRKSKSAKIKSKKKNKYCLVTEFVDGYDLTYILNSIAKRSKDILHHTEHLKLTQAFLLNLILMIVESVAKAHAEGLIHLDVKLDNCILEGRRVRLIDRAYAHKQIDWKTPKNFGFLGTPDYFSPEMLRRCDTDVRKKQKETFESLELFDLAEKIDTECNNDIAPICLNPAMDIFSLGICIQKIIFFLSDLFTSEQLAQLNNINRRLLAEEPGQRPTAATVVAWIRDVFQLNLVSLPQSEILEHTMESFAFDEEMLQPVLDADLRVYHVVDFEKELEEFLADKLSQVSEEQESFSYWFVSLRRWLGFGVDPQHIIMKAQALMVDLKEINTPQTLFIRIQFEKVDTATLYTNSFWRDWIHKIGLLPHLDDEGEYGKFLSLHINRLSFVVEERRNHSQQNPNHKTAEQLAQQENNQDRIVEWYRFYTPHAIAQNSQNPNHKTAEQLAQQKNNQDRIVEWYRFYTPQAIAQNGQADSDNTQVGKTIPKKQSLFASI